jgi:hypothetical protein
MCKNNWREDEFFCPNCDKQLDVLEKMPSGDNKNFDWHLDCSTCAEEYFFDTYRFKLVSLTEKRLDVIKKRKGARIQEKKNE